MARPKMEWNIGDICVMVVSVPKRYTQEFEVQSFDGEYYTVKRGNYLHRVSPSRMFQTKEKALASLDGEKPHNAPLRIKNLAELKRAVKPGVEMLTTSHAYHQDIVGLTRQVTKVQTVGFYSVIKDQPNHKYSTCNHGKGFFTEFEKASAYIFDGNTITLLNTRKNDGSILMTFELYGQEQKQAIESEEKNMNEWERMRRMAQSTKAAYPVGTRLELISMDDPYAPVPSGTRGTVQYVDDMGQIGMKWDNGSSLSLIPGEDSFRKLTAEELAEEQDDGMDEDSSPVMGM